MREGGRRERKGGHSNVLGGKEGGKEGGKGREDMRMYWEGRKEERKEGSGKASRYPPYYPSPYLFCSQKIRRLPSSLSFPLPAFPLPFARLSLLSVHPMPFPRL